MSFGADGTVTGGASSTLPSASDLEAYLGNLEGFGDEEAAPEPAPVEDPEPEEEYSEGEEFATETEDGAEAEASEEDVSGDGTPAEDDRRSPHIPRSRFDEVNRKYREAEERLKQLEAWAPAIERLGKVTKPEDVVGSLDQWLEQQVETPAAPAAADTVAIPGPLTEAEVEDAFHAALMARSVDPGEMEAGTYWANRAAFQTALETKRLQEQALAKVQAMEQAAARAQEQAEQARQLARHQMELQKAVQKYPQFADPEAQKALTAYALGFDLKLGEAAEKLSSLFTVAARNQLAEAAVKTAQETRKRPAPSPGRAPSPARPVDTAKMTSAQRVDYVAELLGKHGMD